MSQLSDISLEEFDQQVKEMTEREGFRISELCDLILKKGVLARASDIHIEPYCDAIRCRFRIDGVFQQACMLPAALHDQIVSRIKVQSDLLSHRRDIVQEGILVLLSRWQEVAAHAREAF